MAASHFRAMPRLIILLSRTGALARYPSRVIFRHLILLRRNRVGLAGQALPDNAVSFFPITAVSSDQSGQLNPVIVRGGVG